MGRHARPRALKPMHALLAAAATAAAAVALIIAPGTTAALSAQAAGQEQQVTAGGLTLTISQATTWTTMTGSTRGITTTGSTGIVPGVRGALITFTIRNDSSSAVPAKLGGSIVAPKTAAWTAASPYATVTGGGTSGCAAGAVTASESTLMLPVTHTSTLAPGASCTITVAVTLARYSSTGTDAAIALQRQRLSDLVAFTLDATLTQTAR